MQHGAMIGVQDSRAGVGVDRPFIKTLRIPQVSGLEAKRRQILQSFGMIRINPQNIFIGAARLRQLILLMASDGLPKVSCDEILLVGSWK